MEAHSRNGKPQPNLTHPPDPSAPVTSDTLRVPRTPVAVQDILGSGLDVFRVHP